VATRCITTVKDEAGFPIVHMYRHYDGDPGAHGKELRKFVGGKKIVNGFSPGPTTGLANGMGDLAAQMVAYFKTEPGNIYLVSPLADPWQVSYTYTIFLNSDATLEIGVEEHCGS